MRILRELGYPDVRPNVLDFGCGLGEFGVFLKGKLGCPYFGIDVSEEAIRYAREILGLNAIALDILHDRLPTGMRSYDLILIHEVLEHLTAPKETLSRLLPLSAKGAVVVLTTPNAKFKSFISRSQAHVHEYTKDELVELVGSFQCTPKLWYIGGYLTALLEVVQRRLFPVGAVDNSIYYRSLGVKAALWLLLLKPFTVLAIFESYLMRFVGTGYHFLCILNTP